MAAPSDVHRHRSFRTPSWNLSCAEAENSCFQIGERLQRIFGALPHARGAVEPAPGGDVGDGVGLADNMGPAFKVFVQDLVVAFRLAPVPVHRVVEAPGRSELEMHGLAGERAEARVEEQEPGEQLRSVFGRAEKLPGLLGEINEDRGGVDTEGPDSGGRSTHLGRR